MSDDVTDIAQARARKAYIVYSDELLEIILDRIAQGEALTKICSADDMPARKTFFSWVAKDNSIRAQYEFAMQMRADMYAEETIAIADDGENDTYSDEDGNKRTDQDVIARSRLRVDARKWYASKLAPKKYGDKIEHSGTGEGGALVVQIVKFGDSDKTDE